MRSKTTGLVLALVLGAASAGLAQQPSREHKDTSRQGRHEAHARKEGRGFAMLFKGIDLSDQQKSQLKALRDQQGLDRAKQQHSALRAEIKTARERGDSAKVRELRQQQFARMQQHREQWTRQVRAILTPAQQQVFDRNVADAKERFAKRVDKRVKRAEGQRRS